jgi:threonine dehydrogenase-like Zn-dependent dehydrogenase
MKAIRFDGSLRFAVDVPVPRREGEALVQVLCAGICKTDLEIVKGYAGFRGTLGHEFVGLVVESPDEALIGRRVVGEINVGCNRCELCLSGDSRHCTGRTVLGIKGRDGAFAEFLSLPPRNLIEVPDEISDEEAIFTEPIAAACQILDQISISPSSRVVVIGDGKLAQLIIRVLAQTSCNLTLIGKHRRKLELASVAVRHLFQIRDRAEPASILKQVGGEKFDVVVEASGSPSGLPLAISLVRPRGTIILKSTHHATTPVAMSPVVVDEISIIGSRCGRFHRALALLASKAIDVRDLISERIRLDQGLHAFDRAAEPTALKVILEASGENFC